MSKLQIRHLFDGIRPSLDGTNQPIMTIYAKQTQFAE